MCSYRIYYIYATLNEGKNWEYTKKWATWHIWNVNNSYRCMNVCCTCVFRYSHEQEKRENKAEEQGCVAYVFIPIEGCQSSVYELYVCEMWMSFLHEQTQGQWRNSRTKRNKYGWTKTRTAEWKAARTWIHSIINIFNIRNDRNLWLLIFEITSSFERLHEQDRC